MGRERLLVKEHTECALILNPALNLAQLFLQQSLVFSTIGAEVQPSQEKETAIRNPQMPAVPGASPLASATPQLQLLLPAGLGSSVAYADFMGEN